MQMLDTRLGQSPFVAGPGSTIGDMPTAVIAYQWYNLPIEREDMPHLKRWFDAIATHPGFKKHVMGK